jgi:hypothetical protein
LLLNAAAFQTDIQRCNAEFSLLMRLLLLLPGEGILFALLLEGDGRRLPVIAPGYLCIVAIIADDIRDGESGIEFIQYVVKAGAAVYCLFRVTRALCDGVRQRVQRNAVCFF